MSNDVGPKLTMEEKLNQILDILKPKDLPAAELKTYNPPIEWKSVFISAGFMVALLLGYYFVDVQNYVTNKDFKEAMQDHREAEWRSYHDLSIRVFDLERDVKKLKEHRIGSVGSVGDEGPK